MNNPLVSLIVINYNGLKYIPDILNECIQSLCDLKYDNLEILFIDNGSVDKSIEFIKNNFNNDKINIIALNDNYGTSKAKNIGIKKSRGKYVVLLNNDVVLPNDTINKMVSFIENKDLVASLGVKLLNSDGTLQSAGKTYSYTASFIWAFLPSMWYKIFQNQNLKNIQNEHSIVDYNIGAVLMIRKSIVNKIMYDEDYWMYGEEIDLAIRINKMGYKNVCLNTCKVLHYGNVTGKNFNDWKRDLVARNELLIILKNYKQKYLFRPIFIYIISIMRDFITSFINNDPYYIKQSFSKIKAFMYVKKPAELPT